MNITFWELVLLAPLFFWPFYSVLFAIGVAIIFFNRNNEKKTISVIGSLIITTVIVNIICMGIFIFSPY